MAVAGGLPQVLAQLRAGFDERVNRNLFPTPQRVGRHADHDAGWCYAGHPGAADRSLGLPKAVNPAKRRLLHREIGPLPTREERTGQRPFWASREESVRGISK